MEGARRRLFWLLSLSLVACCCWPPPAASAALVAGRSGVQLAAPASGACDDEGICCNGVKCGYTNGTCCPNGFCCPTGTTCLPVGRGQLQRCGPGLNGNVITVPVPFYPRDYAEEKAKQKKRMTKARKEAEDRKQKLLNEYSAEKQKKRDAVLAQEQLVKKEIQQLASAPLPASKAAALSAAYKAAQSVSAVASQQNDLAISVLANEASQQEQQELYAQNQQRIAIQERNVKSDQFFSELNKHIQKIDSQRKGLAEGQLDSIDSDIKQLQHQLDILNEAFVNKATWKHKHAATVAKRELETANRELDKLTNPEVQQDQVNNWMRQVDTMKAEQSREQQQQGLAEQEAMLDSEIQNADAEYKRLTQNIILHSEKHAATEQAEKRQQQLIIDEQYAEQREKYKAAKEDTEKRRKAQDEVFEQQEHEDKWKDHLRRLTREKSHKKFDQDKEHAEKGLQIERDQKADVLENKRKFRQTKRIQKRTQKRVERGTKESAQKRAHIAHLKQIRTHHAVLEQEMLKQNRQLAKELEKARQDLE